MKTIGDILNLIHSDDTIQFDANEIRLCKTTDDRGNWYSVLEVTPYGLRMNNGEVWEYSKLSQGEIELVYQECKNVILSVSNGINKKDNRIMNKELISKITDYVEKNVGEFHSARITKLQKINLTELLARKNPYMFKAKNIVTAGEMVESLAAAYMSSAEESIFGNWMEGIAQFVAETVYGGKKSAAEGIDLEFDKDGIHYFVSVKSGPSWSNSTSMKKQKEQFVKAVKVFNTSRKTVPTMCIEGCCYGNDNKSYNDSTHEKYCGEKFWALISGEPTLFVDIIEPLGYKAKEKNEEYYKGYSRMINKLTKEFINDYCNAAGDIEWEKIVRLNAAIKAPKKL